MFSEVFTFDIKSIYETLINQQLGQLLSEQNILFEEMCLAQCSLIEGRIAIGLYKKARPEKKFIIEQSYRLATAFNLFFLFFVHLFKLFLNQTKEISVLICNWKDNMLDMNLESTEK